MGKNQKKIFFSIFGIRMTQFAKKSKKKILTQNLVLECLECVECGPKKGQDDLSGRCCNRTGHVHKKVTKSGHWENGENQYFLVNLSPCHQIDLKFSQPVKNVLSLWILSKSTK